MKRTIVILIAVTGAAVLVFALAANLFPIELEGSEHRKEHKTTIFGESAPKMDSNEVLAATRRFG